MKCIYCRTNANNRTTKKGLYVCCCYMLQKENGVYKQKLKNGKVVEIKENKCTTVTTTESVSVSTIYRRLNYESKIWRFNMRLYPTKQELYDSCMKSEAGIKVIAVAVFNEDGELLGYKKDWVE